MPKQSEKHPILRVLHSTSHNNIIHEAYAGIRQFSLCWLAYEQLEHRYQGHFITSSLFFESMSNQIEFIDISTGKVVARIEFDPSLAQAPDPVYGKEDIIEELQLVC